MSHKKDAQESSIKAPQQMYPKFVQRKQPNDYYQIDNTPLEAQKKGEIISILSMEINESDALSNSYSYKNNQMHDLYNQNSKRKLEKALGIDKFENQKTQKQNIKYLKQQFNVEEAHSPLKGVGDNFNLVDKRPIQSRHLKHRRVEYREKLEEEKGFHKKAKSHRNNKYQYIRNNHDIMTRHQRHKSSDSTENSILKRSNGFEILYRRGEKLEKMLNHYESDGHPHEASS